MEPRPDFRRAVEFQSDRGRNCVGRGAGRNIVIPFSLTSVCSHVAGSASKKADEGWLNKLGTNKDSSMNFLLTSQFSSIAGCQP